MSTVLFAEDDGVEERDHLKRMAAKAAEAAAARKKRRKAMAKRRSMSTQKVQFARSCTRLQQRYWSALHSRSPQTFIVPCVFAC